MGTPVASSQSGSGVVNFTTYELQILSVSGTTNPGAFATLPGENANDCMLYNGGTSPAYVVFSTQPSPTAKNAAGGASGTQTTYIAPGAYIVVQKGAAGYFDSVTDTGTTTLYLHAGRGG